MSSKDCPERILMLVPHEPDADPRVRWVMQLCREIGPTEVIGLSAWNSAGVDSNKPVREAEGNIYVERIDLHEYASMRRKAWAMLTSFLSVGGTIRRYLERKRNTPSPDAANADGEEERLSWVRRIDHRIGSWCRFHSVWAAYELIIDSLYRRARSSSVIPRVIICHDVLALAAAIRLKPLFRCSVLYDAHELWPEADLLAEQWERNAMADYEGGLVRQADAVVTVTPQIARHLERQYRLSNVICAPNATPVEAEHASDELRPASLPVKCLFQGQVTWRRGLEELLTAWQRIDPKLAVLYLRCPENEYLSYLKTKFDQIIRDGRVILLPAVREEQLVAAARTADVGVIPYVGPNLNHVYCCPNKLSQYMQAGLAILSNRLAFVSDVIARHQCGLTYEADKPATLVEAVHFLAENPAALLGMRRRAGNAARMDFNWQHQSAAYKRAIATLYAG
ncbi:MAG: glycosyltransferase family 4 protein [Nitrospira sp.]